MSASYKTIQNYLINPTSQEKLDLLERLIEEKRLKDKIAKYEILAGLPKGWSDALITRTQQEKLDVLGGLIEKKRLKDKIAEYEVLAGLPKGWSDNLITRSPQEKLDVLERSIARNLNDMEKYYTPKRRF